MGERKSFVLYFDWEESLSTLNNEQAGALLRAMFAYNKRGQLYDGADPAVAASFGFVRAAFDRDSRKYKERYEKMTVNGRKGGLAKASKSKQMVANSSKAKQTLANLADNDNDNANANDNENDNDNVSSSSPTPAGLVASAAAGGENLGWLFELCRTVTGITPNGDEQQTLIDWHQKHGRAALERLFDEAAKHKARRFGYLRAIMNRWEQTGFPAVKTKCVGPEAAKACYAVTKEQVATNYAELQALLEATSEFEPSPEDEERPPGGDPE